MKYFCSSFHPFYIADEKDSISSDGEFEDDELLQMLRRRRAQFEQQLLQLDQMIQDTQP